MPINGYLPTSVPRGILEDVDLYKIRKTSYFQRLNEHEDIEELSESIRQNGLLQPIIVRPIENELDDLKYYFEIVAGNRRYDACKSLGWRKIFCHIVNVDIKIGFEISLTENIQRKTMDPIEEAIAFKKYVLDYGWGGISYLASRIGRSVSYVDKRIKLLNLPQNIIESITSSEISASIAEELLSIDDINKQSELGKIMHDKQLSVMKMRSLVNSMKSKDVCSDYEYLNPNTMADLDVEVNKAFDKSILVISLAIRKLATIIGEMEENWMIYEILMQHKRMLHDQIDLLIKEKKKV